jgi:thioredoxin 1
MVFKHPVWRGFRISNFISIYKKEGLMKLNLAVIMLIGIILISCNNKKSDNSSILELSKSDNFDEIIKSDTPVLIDFYADWCKPCKQQTPILKELKNELKDNLIIIKVDIDKFPELANRHQIKSIPYLVIYYKGSAQWSAVGMHNKTQLQTLIENITKNK